MNEPTTELLIAEPMKEPSIDAKPAAGVFTGALTVLGLSLANRYTAYQPTIEEATSITVIVSGLAMWLIPSAVRRKLNGEGE